MKQLLYDILDGEYCLLLDRIIEIFGKKKLNPTIVGGAATQVNVAHLLSKIYGTDIEHLFLNEDLRPQDHMRSTDDVDVAVYNRELAKKSEKYQKKILEAIDEIPCENVQSPDGNDLYDILLERRGLVKPIFLIKSLNKQPSQIRINISDFPNDLYHLDSKHYVDLIKNGKMIELNYNSKYKPKIRTLALDDLIAAKIAHNRLKDQFDAKAVGVTALLAGRKIDKKRIIHLLGETNYNIEKVEDFLEEIKELKNQYKIK